LLLQVKLLVLSSHRVHHHDNPLGFIAVILEAEGGYARVGECRLQCVASGYCTPQILRLSPACQSSSQRQS
jgi:hypothetical protein